MAPRALAPGRFKNIWGKVQVLEQDENDRGDAHNNCFAHGAWLDLVPECQCARSIDTLSSIA
jgi:hypothetical protein